METAAAAGPGAAAALERGDLDARWTVKTGRQRPPDGAGQQLPTIAIPVFGYKNHVAIDRRFGFIWRAAVTDAACHDGSMLSDLVTSDNLAASVWADTAYRSAANEAWLASLGWVSRIHRKKPPGRPMPRPIARGNARKSSLRATVEHVFAHQKERMGLRVRTIGLARARTKIGLANLAYNFQRLVFTNDERLQPESAPMLPGGADQPRRTAPSRRQGLHPATSAIGITLLTKPALASADSWKCSVGWAFRDSRRDECQSDCRAVIR